MSAPERIWAGNAGPDLGDTWADEPEAGWSEYIRADAVAEMIRQAVEQEREACAQAAHDWQNETGTDIAAAVRICPQIAAAIRARGET